MECDQVSSAKLTLEHLLNILDVFEEKNKWNVKLLMFTQCYRTNSTL